LLSIADEVIDSVSADFGGLSPCLVGLEACPSAHYWSRKLQALGHTVRLMPPNYVKAYLKRSKNDANDAAAICGQRRGHRCGLLRSRPRNNRLA
jgi:transposase